jgi:DNA-binding response OmpR family regulator
MPPRVLIIEPSIHLREKYKRALEGRGLAVRASASAVEALEESDDFHPDFVIADYQMGDEPAFEAMGELRRNNPGVVVLLTSDAFATPQTLGSITLLPKPSEPRALLDLLRTAVTADSLWLVRRAS